MPFTDKQIRDLFREFNNSKSVEHRYISFDYCFSYFNSFNNKSEIAHKKNIEKSCLHLGFYLASWGMLRASSVLLQKSFLFYKRIIECIANDCDDIWNIDVNKYNSKNIIRLQTVHNNLSDFIPDENRKIVIVTKIMLGVFGCSPAFDNYFTTTFRSEYGKDSRFRKFEPTALNTIKEFYKKNKDTINKLRYKCRVMNFSGEITDLFYTRAKVIDMIGFQYGKNLKEEEDKLKKNLK